MILEISLNSLFFFDKFCRFPLFVNHIIIETIGVFAIILLDFERQISSVGAVLVDDIEVLSF